MQAAIVFALTLFALFWGVSFSFSAPPPVTVLDTLPTLIQNDTATRPLPKPKPEPEPEAESIPETNPKPAPKPKPTTKSDADADIALKQKQKAQEEKRRKEEERERQKRKEEAEAKKKKEEEQRKKREAQKRREEERKRKDEEERKRREEAQQKLLDQQQRERDIEQRIARESALGKERRTIEGQIRGRIERTHNHPQSVPADADIEVKIKFCLTPDGTGRARLKGLPDIIQSSGNKDYDKSVWRAIVKAEVFSFPTAPELAEEFSCINLTMSPLDK